MEMSSFWWNFHHWLHWKLSFWQLPVQAVMKISSKWHFHFSAATCTWWYHDKITISSLLSLCEGNPSVSSRFPHKWTERMSFESSLLQASSCCSTNIRVFSAFRCLNPRRQDYNQVAKHNVTMLCCTCFKSYNTFRILIFKVTRNYCH